MSSCCFEATSAVFFLVRPCDYAATSSSSSQWVRQWRLQTQFIDDVPRCEQRQEIPQLHVPGLQFIDNVVDVLGIAEESTKAVEGFHTFPTCSSRGIHTWILDIFLRAFIWHRTFALIQSTAFGRISRIFT